MRKHDPIAFTVAASDFVDTCPSLYLLDRVQCTTDLLVCADRILRKNGIAYFMDYGSLLGAVRHEGVIPWDDTGDIDVGFLKKDESRIFELRVRSLPHMSISPSPVYSCVFAFICLVPVHTYSDSLPPARSLDSHQDQFESECNAWMIHRTDTEWYPSISSFVIKRGCFRLFCKFPSLQQLLHFFFFNLFYLTCGYFFPVCSLDCL